jgi:hypothetical protein
MSITDTDLDALLDRLLARAGERPLPALADLDGHVLGAVPYAATGRLQVATGDLIQTLWGNTVWDQSVNTFATTAARDSQWPAPLDGAMCYTLDAPALWCRKAGQWLPVGGSGQAPLTAGQPLTAVADFSGETWVAKAGVNAGVWRKARDVLNCTYWRATAFSISTTASPINMDTAVYDPFGLYSAAIFTAPVAGLYRLAYQLSASATAAGQNLQPQLTVSSMAGNWLSENVSGGAQVFSAQVVLSLKLTAAQTVTTKMLGTGIAGWNGTYGCWFSADYAGTG